MPTTITISNDYSYRRDNFGRTQSGSNTGSCTPQDLKAIVCLVALVGWGFLTYYSSMLGLCYESDNSRKEDCTPFSNDASSIKFYIDVIYNAFPDQNVVTPSSKSKYINEHWVTVLHCEDKPGAVLFDNSGSAKIEIGDVRQTAHVLSKEEISNWSEEMPDTQGYPRVYSESTNGEKSKVCFFPDKDWGEPKTLYSNPRKFTDFDACSDSSTCMEFSKKHWTTVLSIKPMYFAASISLPFILFVLYTRGPAILNRIHTGASRVGSCGRRALDSIGSTCSWATSFCGHREGQLRQPLGQQGLPEDLEEGRMNPNINSDNASETLGEDGSHPEGIPLEVSEYEHNAKMAIAI